MNKIKFIQIMNKDNTKFVSYIKSREIFLIASNHSINMSTFSLKQSDFCFKILDFFRQEFN